MRHIVVRNRISTDDEVLGGEVDSGEGTVTNAHRIASAFVEARRSGKALANYPGQRPRDLTQAYEIQDHALEMWDRPVGGWKVGRIGEPTASSLGANRLVGPIFAATIVMSGEDTVAMPVFTDGFAAAEAEFMLRLSPPAVARVPSTNAEAMEWVDEIRIGIEIASSPYAGINRDGPCVTISDHGNNAGLVLGELVDRSHWGDLAAITVALDVEGVNVGRASVATMLDGPFGAVRFLLANLESRGISPEAGWWISSGAITGVHDVKIGDATKARFEGIGEIAATIAACSSDET